MASNVYIQCTVGGKSHLARRSVKQGRKPLPAGYVKIPVTTFILPKTKTRLEARAKELNMSLSAYIELAVSLFDIRQFSDEENCSIQ